MQSLTFQNCWTAKPAADDLLLSDQEVVGEKNSSQLGYSLRVRENLIAFSSAV